MRENRKLLDLGKIDTLIESKENINKDPMMRLLLERAETEYVLWFDDDTHVMPGWNTAIEEFIAEKHPFDVAGHIFYCERSEEYIRFLRNRPWWMHVELQESVVWFPTGGFFLARTNFLIENNFPDSRMIKKQDDLLLGDLILQKKGKLLDFGGNRAIMDRVMISDGNRRGTGEGSDGWLEPALEENTKS